MTTLDLGLCYQELGFAEPPFRITPDTDFFFPGSRHLEDPNANRRQWIHDVKVRCREVGLLNLHSSPILKIEVGRSDILTN